MTQKKLPSKDELVIRSFIIPDIRAADEEGVVEGHAAVYDQETQIGCWFYEKIERGAFDGCDFDDVMFTANHEVYKTPLARSRRNNSNSTLQLSLDDKGLFVRAKLDIENNSEARNLYSAIKRQDITGMSFIFYVKEEKWSDMDKDMPKRSITKIKKVREVSAVNDPAYEGTDINARDKEALDNAKLALENARSQELENSKAVDILKLKNKILGGL